MTRCFTDSLTAFAAPVLDKARDPSAAVGVIGRDGTAHTHAWGSVSRTTSDPITSATVFGIASITKSFGSAVAMTLQDRGLLDIDEPISAHLPELRMPDPAHLAKVTTRHLMSHTSGLPPLRGLRAAMYRSHQREDPAALAQYESGPGDDCLDTHEDLIRFLSQQDYAPLGEPGTEFSYSNDGYGLLGAIIERVSGEPMADYLTRSILEPLGMTRTGFDVTALIKQGNVVTPAVLDDETDDAQIADSPLWWEAPAMAAAGYLRSCVDDLLTYIRMFLGEGEVAGTKVLSPEAVRTMTTPVVQVSQTSFYGCGLTIVPDYHGVRMVEHGGSLKSITSRLQFVPDVGVGTITLINLRGAPARRIGLAALNLADGHAAERSHVAPRPGGLALPEGALSEYEGVYESAEDVQLTITASGDSLEMVSRIGKPSTLLPTAWRDEFVVDDAVGDTNVRFLRDSSGLVVRVLAGLRQLGRVRGPEPE
ncbi:MAG: serine hydrolase domain-containing protein [Propionibacteriaceae bacterium]